MRTLGLNKIKTVEKEVEIKDFQKVVEYCESVYPTEKGLKKAPSVNFTEKLKNGIRCVKLYKAESPVYYCTDGRLYRKVNGEYKAYGIPVIASAPDIFTVNYNGMKTLAVVTPSSAYLMNDTYSYINIPKGDDYIVYKGRLIIAKGRKILLCGEADYTGENISVIPDNFLTIDGRLGSVDRLIIMSGELYAVCSRGIVKIEVSVDDLGFTLKEMSIPPFKTDSLTAVGIANAIYFMNINGLNAYTRNNVVKIESMLDELNYSVCGEAVSKDNLYLLPINLNGTKKIFCYDTLNKRQTFIGGENLLIGKDGVAIKTDTNDIGEITDGESLLSIFKSKKTNFDYSGYKVLSSISVKSKSVLTFTVYGDGEYRTFVLSDGEIANLNLTAKEFSYTVVSNGNMEVEELKIRYRK